MDQLLPPLPQPTQPRQAEKNPKPKPVKDWIEPKEPVLRFSPTAWAKLLFFRDRGDCEIGGFGITGADDLLRIEDF